MVCRRDFKAGATPGTILPPSGKRFRTRTAETCYNGNNHFPDPERGIPMQSAAATVEQYLSELPPERRQALEAVRKVVLANLDPDYQEAMQYGMIGYSVPHSVYPAGYHCDPKQPLPFAGLAAQKNHLAIYLMCIYGHPEHEAWFRQAWAKTGKKLDMGKSCIRFKKLDDLALDVLGEAIRRVPAAAFIEHYEQAIKNMGKKNTASAQKSPKKPAAKGKAPAKAAKTKAASPRKASRGP